MTITQDDADLELEMLGLPSKSKRSSRASVRVDEEIKRGWSTPRKKVAFILEHSVTELVMAVLITANAVFIIIETDIRAAEREDPLWRRSAGYGFLAAYTVDVALRIYCYQRLFFTQVFNNLDLFVVVVDIAGELLVGSLGDLPSLSVLRILRIFRLMRFVHVLTLFKELHMMLHGFMSAMKAIFWATFMLVIMLTLWSIVAVEIIHPKVVALSDEGHFEGCERCQRAFASVMASNLTFIQQIVAGDSWGAVSVPVIEYHPETAVVFLGSLITVELGMLNLILTVIVNAAQEARDADLQRKIREKEHEFEKAKRRLVKLCRELDTDRNGELSLEEMLIGMEENRAFGETISLMDVKKEDMTTIFSLLDENGDGKVIYREFVEQLYRMKAQDANTHLIFLKGSVNSLRSSVNTLINIVQNEVLRSVDGVLDGVIHLSDATVQHPPAALSTWRINASRELLERELAVQAAAAAQEQPQGLAQQEAHTAAASTPSAGASVSAEPRLQYRKNQLSSSTAAHGYASISQSSNSTECAPPVPLPEPDARLKEVTLSQELADLRHRVESDLAEQMRESARRAEENARSQALKIDALFKLVSQEQPRREGFMPRICGFERATVSEMIAAPHPAHGTVLVHHPNHQQGPGGILQPSVFNTSQLRSTAQGPPTAGTSTPFSIPKQLPTS